MRLLELGRKKIMKDCDIHRHKIAAIAFLPSGHVVATTTNKVGRGEVSDFSLHAEEHLVSKLIRLRAKERFGTIFVIVMRWARSKGWAMAKPCRGCERKLRRYKIKQIMYTNDDGAIDLL